MSNYELQKNNVVKITGKFCAGFSFSHEVCGEKFFLSNISVERISGTCDILPIIVSERLIDVSNDYSGKYVEVNGQFRSHNCHDEGWRRLFLAVFATEIRFPDSDDEPDPLNQIFLDGYICKAPVYRKTPMGREIADVLLAVNRPYRKSDYIPLICWGRNASFSSYLVVGTRIRICGRIQSRVFNKHISDDGVEKRTAYEVSVKSMEVCEQ